jgi:PPOX class probable F420-dependent enzyme
MSSELDRDAMTKLKLAPEDRAFVDAQPVARLATADKDGVPPVVPIWFFVQTDTLYVTVDRKPKRTGGRPLKRLRNIAENPNVCVIVDRYDADWSRLGWVMVRGQAEILEGGDEHAAAQAGLAARYPQYRDMSLKALPVIAVRIVYIARWGNLSVNA